MATSDKQIDANRRNAKLSTGPRTEAGKTRSSMNGFKHPWLGVSTIMTEEDCIAMRDFVREYTADWAPQGPIETQEANTIAMDNWRINRIKGVEENIFAWGYEMDPGMKCHAEIVEVENCLTHATSYIRYSEVINRISLYESRLNRIIVRNTELLNKRQAERRNREKQAPKMGSLSQFPLSQKYTPSSPASRSTTSQKPPETPPKR